jgi:hypothetical protein
MRHSKRGRRQSDGFPSSTATGYESATDAEWTTRNTGYTRLEKRPQYSGAKCVGQTLSVLDPRTRSCSYRNICFDKKEEKFKIFVKAPKDKTHLTDFYKHHKTIKDFSDRIRSEHSVPSSVSVSYNRRMVSQSLTLSFASE